MKKLLILGACLFSLSANAQSVRQSGNITPGNVAKWVTTGVIADGGPASGTVIVGSTTPNDFVCFNASPALIDCGLSATGTNNWAGIQNFNGGATAPTRTAGDATTNLATTQFVQNNSTANGFVFVTQSPYNASTGGTGAANATAFNAALAANTNVIVPPGTYSVNSWNVPAGTTLEYLTGAKITYTSSAPVLNGDGATIFDRNYSGDNWVIARAFTGTRSITGDPFAMEQWGQAALGMIVYSDDSALGTNQGNAGQFIYNYGGSAMTGNRGAIYARAQQTAVTNASNPARNYVGLSGVSYTNTGDGGTNTGAGARGAYFGVNAQCILGASATNALNCFSLEADVFAYAGSTVKYLAGVQIANFQYIHGATIDAGLVFYGGGPTSGGGTPVGWTQGIFFTDVPTGAPPVLSTGSVLTASFPNLGNPQTVAHGIDLSNFSCTSDCFKSTGFLVDGTGAVTAGSWTGSGAAVILNATAPPAGGTAGFGYRFSSTANLGTFFGSGAPSLSAAQGSLYLRTDGVPYYNTNGTTGWGSLAPLASPSFTGTVTFANLAAVGLLASTTAPVIGSCGGGSPAIAAHNGTAAFRITVGSGNSTCAITLPTAPTGWNCFASDITTASATVFVIKQTASSTTSATLGNFNTSGAAANFVNGDTFYVSCFAL